MARCTADSSSLASRHATKADVARRAVDMLRMPRRRAVALAIVDGAQVRSALHNLAADARAGGRIVIALRERRTARVGDRAAGRFGPRALRRRIPVPRPFPDIAATFQPPHAILRKASPR